MRCSSRLGHFNCEDGGGEPGSKNQQKSRPFCLHPMRVSASAACTAASLGGCSSWARCLAIANRAPNKNPSSASSISEAVASQPNGLSCQLLQVLKGIHFIQ